MKAGEWVKLLENTPYVSDIEVKPHKADRCYICGGKPQLIKWTEWGKRKRFLVECKECGNCDSEEATIRDATRVWNTSQRLYGM